MAALAEISPRLWRWTARHPEGVDDPEPESPDDWDPEVGCVAYAAPDDPGSETSSGAESSSGDGTSPDATTPSSTDS